MAKDAIQLTALTVDLLNAFCSNNTVRSDALAALVASTYAALAGLNARSGLSMAVASHEFVGAVSIRKSLASRDCIISMIDGKPYKLLKRHLSSHGLTPDTYRKRYGLPADYPMVAPGFSERRSGVSKRLGLGRKPKK